MGTFCSAKNKQKNEQTKDNNNNKKKSRLAEATQTPENDFVIEPVIACCKREAIQEC